MSINADAFSSPEWVAEDTVTVLKEICALEVIPTDAGSKLGLIALLPKGTRLERCGCGFNERSLKVRSEGHLYFVFLQDLESLEGLGAECGTPFPVTF